MKKLFLGLIHGRKVVKYWFQELSLRGGYTKRQIGAVKTYLYTTFFFYLTPRLQQSVHFLWTFGSSFGGVLSNMEAVHPVVYRLWKYSQRPCSTTGICC